MKNVVFVISQGLAVCIWDLKKGLRMTVNTTNLA